MSLLFRGILGSYWNHIYSAVDILQIRVHSNRNQDHTGRARRNGHINAWSIGLVALTIACTALCGCGSYFTLNSISGSLVASPASVSFGAVKLGETSSATISFLNQGASSVQLSQVGVNGKSFSAASAGTLPVTIAPGAEFHVNVQFKPSAAGASSGQLVISSSSFTKGTEAVDLSGSGTATPTVSTGLTALSCANSSMTGSGVDACTVTLGSSAPSGGLSVSLSSSSGAVKLPTSVTVAASSTSADFNATVSAVDSTQTVSLKASEGGTSSTFQLQLKGQLPPISGGAAPSLSVSTNSVGFGDVVVNTPATQSITLSSTGGAAVIISAANVTGKGFKLEGATFPMTLQPKQTATLNVQFDPAATGSVQGQLVIASNASNSPSYSVTLTGAGVTHQVQLNWNAPANSPVTIQGYRVYRATGGGSVFQVLNSNLNSTTSYVDGSVVSGQTYDYVVKSVDAEGAESGPSNTTSVTIP